MNFERHHGGWVILTSFALSFMLAIMPLPAWATIWRPDWIAMVLIYWCIAVPQRVGVTTGWLVGIIYDVLSDTLLGQHGLSLSLIAYFSVKRHRRARLFPRWRQAIQVFVLITFSQLLSAIISSVLGHPQSGWSFICPAVTSMILWPWIFVLLRDMRRTHRVF